MMTENKVKKIKHQQGEHQTGKGSLKKWVLSCFLKVFPQIWDPKGESSPVWELLPQIYL